MTDINIDLNAELKKCKTMEDLTGKNGLLQRLLKGMMENLLEQEMQEHLGYEKHSVKGDNSGNSRNGKSQKNVTSSFGPIDIEVPRDRNAEFEPQIVKKRQRDISSFDDKIISMYAKGMTTRDIQSHIQDIYGIEISPTMVSNITNKVVDVATEWQARPLSSIYPIIFFDAIHYKVKEDGKVISKAAYTCLGIDWEGKKDILGLWIGESEGAKFWLRICTELQNRGIADIFIACIDGLKGLPEAIQSVFPQVQIQLCIVHMIRNSIKYIPHKYLKEFIFDLKTIYGAVTEATAKNNLGKLQEKWEGRYPLAVKPWIVHWENVRTFFQFPDSIRKLIYTTNAVEALHRQFRKVTKNKAVFPSDDALFKMLFLAARDISKKWTLPLQDWKNMISQLSVFFGDRL
jgi:putative transposase